MSAPDETPLTFVERVCPVCDTAGTVVGSTVDPDSERYGLPETPVPLRRCPACGMRFYDLIEEVNTAGQIYGRMLLSGEREAPRHRSFARLLAGACPDGARVLDLGSGACHVGRRLPPSFEVTAVDTHPNAEGAPAHVSFRDANITALPDSTFPARSFDWVILDNVLEHLPAFSGLLGQARRWLAPGGRLLVVVPNGRTLKRHLGGRQLREVFRPVEHVNIFEGRTLDAALRRADLEPVAQPFAPRSVFEAAVAASLLGWAPFGLYRVCAVR
jgi:SAM-dependent methyltransferase